MLHSENESRRKFQFPAQHLIKHEFEWFSVGWGEWGGKGRLWSLVFNFNTWGRKVGLQVAWSMGEGAIEICAEFVLS